MLAVLAGARPDDLLESNLAAKTLACHHDRIACWDVDLHVDRLV